jgi:hypothetical protein
MFIMAGAYLFTQSQFPLGIAAFVIGLSIAVKTEND